MKKRVLSLLLALVLLLGMVPGALALEDADIDTPAWALTRSVCRRARARRKVRF